MLENEVLQLAKDALLSDSFSKVHEETITKLTNSNHNKLENDATSIGQVQEEKRSVESIIGLDQTMTTNLVGVQREPVPNTVCLDDDPIVISNSKIGSFGCTKCFKNFSTNRKLNLHMSYHGFSSKCSTWSFQAENLY